MLKKILIAVVVIIVGIQFIPIERSNPPVTQEIDAPKNVLSILKTSCFDCHSNETEWPWYSYVAPVSFLIADDVHSGRNRMNFSEWDKYDEKKKAKKLDHIEELVRKGAMPLPKYTFIHSDAKLDSDKINQIKVWVESELNREEPVRYKKEDE